MALRYLRGSGAARRLMAGLSPPGAISLIYGAWINARRGSFRHPIAFATPCGCSGRFFTAPDRVRHPQNNHEGRTQKHQSTSPNRSRPRECRAETKPKYSKVQMYRANPNYQRRHSSSTARIPKWSWTPNARMEPGKHQEAEHGQCALRLLGRPKHH